MGSPVVRTGETFPANKKTPREREVCAQSGTDCALGDNDRAEGGHRGRVKHASPVTVHPPVEIGVRVRRGSCYSSAVIPPSWTPVTRPSDAEHVGWLVPGGAPGVVPASLVGAPLGPAQDRAAAAALLVERGLRSLDRRWWCRLPSSMPSGVLSAAEPEPDWEWRAVVLVEVSPSGCTLRLGMGEPPATPGPAP